MNRNSNIEYLMRKKCFPDFLKSMDNKVDTKEWSEIVGMYKFALKYIPKPWTTVFDIGCGVRPTLASFVAYTIKSCDKVIAIDPALRILKPNDVRMPRNLAYVRGVFNKYSVSAMNPDADGPVILFANHAHVSRKDMLGVVKQLDSMGISWYYVTNPCCVDNTLGSGYVAMYAEDPMICSPKNKLYLFKSKGL